MPATTTIEPSEGTSSGHTHTLTLTCTYTHTHTLVPLWCVFGWVERVRAASTKGAKTRSRDPPFPQHLSLENNLKILFTYTLIP